MSRPIGDGGGVAIENDIPPHAGHLKGHVKEDVFLATLPSLMSGAITAVTFNPIDRALFLRVLHKRSLFHIENWRDPFQGFANAAAYRTLSSASYLYWQETATLLLLVEAPWLHAHPITVNFLVGVFAGTMNGIILNPMQQIKYRMWSNRSPSFGEAAYTLYYRGGVRILFRGAGLSVARDTIFGVTYEVLRCPNYTKHHSTGVQLLANSTAASVACVLSAPLNYTRNMVYGCPLRSTPLGTSTLVRYLWLEMTRHSDPTTRLRLVNDRFNVGWGSLRVGIGMACGQHLFHTFKVMLSKHEPKAIKK
jgi:hypothetical protein